MRHLATLNMRFLLNDHAVLTRGDDALVLAGVTDLSAPGHGAPAPDLTKALAGAPPTLRHPARPPTHDGPEFGGGRRIAPAFGAYPWRHDRGLDLLVARANNGFVSGRYEIGGMDALREQRDGLWPGFALRLGVSSELTRITLRRKQ